MRISSIFREIEFTLNEVDKQLVQLQESLDVTSTSHLRYMLISPVKLYAILKEVVLKLPTGVSVVINNELDTVYNYYHS